MDKFNIESCNNSNFANFHLALVAPTSIVFTQQPPQTQISITEQIVPSTTTVVVQATVVTGPFAIQIKNSVCNGQYFNCPGSNVQVGSETNCGAKEAFNLDQFGYLHIGLTDTIACQQELGGFTDFRFLPASTCNGYFSPPTCQIVSGQLICTGFYGTGFSEEFNGIYLGPVDPQNGQALIADIVAYP
jgi:hypothetical protein